MQETYLMICEQETEGTRFLAIKNCSSLAAPLVTISATSGKGTVFCPPLRPKPLTFDLRETLNVFVESPRLMCVNNVQKNDKNRFSVFELFL